MTDFVVDGNFADVALGIAMPFDGATVYARLGTSAVASLKNLATGTSMAAVGVPAYGAGYASLDSNGNCIETGVLEAASCTIIVVARAPTATGTARLFSCNPGGTAKGATLYSTGATNLTLAAHFTDSSSAATCALVLPDRTAWRLYVGEVEEGVGLRLSDETRAAAAATAKTVARSLNTANTFRIGGRPTTLSTGGENDVHTVLYVPRILTADERATALEMIRAWAAYKGIVV